MTTYISGKHFTDIFYKRDDLNLKEFEECTFTGCNFSETNSIGLAFIDCTFTDCLFTGAQLNHTAYRTVHFIGCELLDVNFAMSDKLIFEVHFKECTLDFSKFYGLKMNAATFTSCSLIAVDFMACNLVNVLFDDCDLRRAEFDQADAGKCDFRTARHYTIHPEKTKLKKAVFAREGLGGLVGAFGVEVV